MIWFTSDTHFCHKGILVHRPMFHDVEEMNETLITNWNSRVDGKDDVYHLGDFSFAGTQRTLEVMVRLNGIKYWVTGNHDKEQSKKPEISALFRWIKPYHLLKVRDPFSPHAWVGKQRIVLFHYALRVWDRSHYGTWHLYGHSHGNLFDDPNARSMDVGVDPNKFYPISYDEVKEKMLKKKFIPVDHHQERYNG